MDLPTLESLAEKFLEYGIDTIRENGEIHLQYQLIRADGGIEIVLVDGPITNSRAGKRILSDQIRARCAAGELQAVMMLSDVFYGTTDEQGQKTMDALKLDVEQAHELGLLKKREALLLIVDSPIFHRAIRQGYRRAGRSIEIEDREELPENASGRMVVYFPRTAAAAAQ